MKSKKKKNAKPPAIITACAYSYMANNNRNIVYIFRHHYFSILSRSSHRPSLYIYIMNGYGRGRISRWSGINLLLRIEFRTLDDIQFIHNDVVVVVVFFDAFFAAPVNNNKLGRSHERKKTVCCSA